MKIELSIKDDDGGVTISREVGECPTWMNYTEIFLDALRGAGFVLSKDTEASFEDIVNDKMQSNAEIINSSLKNDPDDDFFENL